jgi:hypothetical protein
MFAHAPCSLTNALIQSASNPRSANCSRFQGRQQGKYETVVVRFASDQRETDGQPTGIADCMNVSRQSASRPANHLLTVRRDARAVLVDADDGRVDHLHRCIMIGGRRVQTVWFRPNWLID